MRLSHHVSLNRPLVADAGRLVHLTVWSTGSQAISIGLRLTEGEARTLGHALIDNADRLLDKRAPRGY